jgi:hypothetical protein
MKTGITASWNGQTYTDFQSFQLIEGKDGGVAGYVALEMTSSLAINLSL